MLTHMIALHRVTVEMSGDEYEGLRKLMLATEETSLASTVRHVLNYYREKNGLEPVYRRVRERRPSRRAELLATRLLDALYDAGDKGLLTAAVAGAIKSSHGEAKAILDALERLGCIERRREDYGRIRNLYVRDLKKGEALE